MCAASCDDTSLKWEYVDWYHEGNPRYAWESIGVPIKNIMDRGNKKAQLATSGHVMIWKKIRDSGQSGIVLEHDALMRHPVNIEIPNKGIVALGYKVKDPKEYNHKKAGAPVGVKLIEGHEGAHAYAITDNTARLLLEEIEKHGIKYVIDITHFLYSRRGYTNIPLYIMYPTPAIAWVRDSTIWEDASISNYEVVKSFKDNYERLER